MKSLIFLNTYIWIFSDFSYRFKNPVYEKKGYNRETVTSVSRKVLDLKKSLNLFEIKK